MSYHATERGHKRSRDERIDDRRVSRRSDGRFDPTSPRSRREEDERHSGRREEEWTRHSQSRRHPDDVGYHGSHFDHRDRDYETRNDRRAYRSGYDRDQAKESDRRSHVNREHARGEGGDDRFGKEDKARQRDGLRNPDDEEPAHRGAKPTREERPDEEYELELEEEDPKRLIEESRRRRKAILEKYSATSTPALSSAVSAPTSDVERSRSNTRDHSPTSRAKETSTEASVEPEEKQSKEFSLEKDGRAHSLSPTSTHLRPAISAADYDPNFDRAEDDEMEQKKLGKPTNANGAQVSTSSTDILSGVGGPATAKGEVEYEEIEVDDEDDLDDMFSFDEKPKKKKIKVLKGTSLPVGQEPVQPRLPMAAALHDNWDDPDGYYRVTLGEKLDDGRYQVFANLGRGMFASVVRARDTHNNDREVAIKIVRTQETMYKAGLKEINILRKLAELDPEDKKHIVRLEGHFEHRGHLCMVFESLSMNLREVVKRFGKDVGLNLRAVRAYAHQLFLALSLMKKASIMHADIKPDNILVNDSKTILKVCDLGSASDLSEMEITPYLVSRFYRAPEIILGRPYDCSLDMWSVGCTLYELATGKILFPGRTNNQMLLLMQEVKGKFTTKQIRKSKFADQHFDDTNTFLSAEKDKSTGQDVIRRVNLQKPVEDLRSKILPGNTAKRMKEDELRLTLNFVDLLNRALELDPAKRLTPKDALAHPFLTS
ncbi:kinase-like protein [Violaceomyces palustris]|uniref:Kinase-like protein n=1 Tax=Violaceomyces palustris TaxID=1673888 RepID=A0ACD0P774_9BASI|nr:kinase-like protein [Violaceomyces palustris]